MIDLKKVSACLITKEKTYPPQVLAQVASFPFGEILILTECDSPFRKYELFTKTKFDYIYYQDDDAICPIRELAQLSKNDIINVAMKVPHMVEYRDLKMTMGLGWGSIFPKKILESLKQYTDRYGEDFIYKRETEKILTALNYPQNRLPLPIIDLPSAYNSDRLWQDKDHKNYQLIAHQRCESLTKTLGDTPKE